MVSGDPPLMALEHWIYCPPRGEFGRGETAYATFDYLLLIMARLVDFGGKDRSRKLRAVEAQGGQWIPPKWLFPNGPPVSPAGAARSGPPANFQPVPLPQHPLSAPKPGLVVDGRPSPTPNEGRARQSKTKLPPTSGIAPPIGGPPMLGMMPPPAAPPDMHSAFQAMDASIRDPAYAGPAPSRQPKVPSGPNQDLDKALHDYESITQAFNLFADTLGEDFRPLSSDENPITSPFGPALVYRNAAIACVWACYYMARISLQRVHPEMPPAAMVAAGVTAHLTRNNAQMVGKICAGLYATQQYGQTGALDPSFAGALMESTIFLLFAGIQFTDAAQRGWTVSKLKDLERRCGWRTSGAIASACETAWERTAQAGRGPPYQRVRDLNSTDARVSGGVRQADQPSLQNGLLKDSVVEQHESEFVAHDRNLIDRSSSTRVHWALGLLAVEEDIKKMVLSDG
jgi:hypothetical protein